MPSGATESVLVEDNPDDNELPLEQPSGCA
jgi:hypothetical protein